jgi:hypothetical protein
MGAGSGKTRRARSKVPSTIYDFPLYTKDPFEDGNVSLYQVIEERPVLTGIPQADDLQKPTLMQLAGVTSILNLEHEMGGTLTLRLNSGNRQDPFNCILPEERRWLGVRGRMEGLQEERFYNLPSLQRAFSELTRENKAGVASFHDIIDSPIHAVRTLSNGYSGEDYITVIHKIPGASWPQLLDLAQDEDTLREDEILMAIADAEERSNVITAFATEDVHSLMRVLEKMRENEIEFDENIRLRQQMIAGRPSLRYEGAFHPIYF